MAARSWIIARLPICSSPCWSGIWRNSKRCRRSNWSITATKNSARWANSSNRSKQRMADRLFISLWLKQWDEDLVLEAFRKLLEVFPYSARRPGVQMVTVQPVDWSEPPSFEQHFTPGASAAAVLEAVEQLDRKSGVE